MFTALWLALGSLGFAIIYLWRPLIVLWLVFVALWPVVARSRSAIAATRQLHADHIHAEHASELWRRRLIGQVADAEEQRPLIDHDHVTALDVDASRGGVKGDWVSSQ
jgi:hypothetical protein